MKKLILFFILFGLSRLSFAKELESKKDFDQEFTKEYITQSQNIIR